MTTELFLCFRLRWCSRHLPLLPNLAVVGASVSADDALWVLHGFDGPNLVVLEKVAVDLTRGGGLGHFYFSGPTERRTECFFIEVQKTLFH